MSNRQIRAEDDRTVYLAEYDSYYVNTIVSLVVIDKHSAMRIAPNEGHYYLLGVLVGRGYFTEVLPERG